jgi:predicted enzyme related to lactoylglutathione lyase
MMTGGKNMLSHISFVSIPATNPERARDFYTGLLGMKVAVDAPYGEKRWIMLEIPGARTQLHLDHVDAMPQSDKPTLPMIVADLAAAVARLRDGGARIVAEPKAADWKPGVDYALVQDSEGNTVLLATG